MEQAWPPKSHTEVSGRRKACHSRRSRRRRSPRRSSGWSITFVALYLVISRIAIPRIGGIFEERAQAHRGRFRGRAARQGRIRGRACGLRKGSGGCPQPRAGDRRRDPRQAARRGRGAPQGARGEAQHAARRRGEADRRHQDRRDGECARHRGRCRERDRRAADRHRSARPRCRGRGRRRPEALKDCRWFSKPNSGSPSPS